MEHLRDASYGRAEEEACPFPFWKRMRELGRSKVYNCI